MTIKTTVITTTMLLAMGLATSGFADSKVEVVDGDTVTIECIAASEVEAMTDEDKAKLTLPICEEAEANVEGTVTQ